MGFSINLFIWIAAARSIIMRATPNFPLSLCPDEPSPDYSFQSQLMVPNQVVNADSSPETSPIRPLPRSASTANLQSASKLILSSKLVYSKRLDLPHGVEVTRATPSAGVDRFHTFDSLRRIPSKCVKTPSSSGWLGSVVSKMSSFTPGCTDIVVVDSIDSMLCIKQETRKSEYTCSATTCWKCSAFFNSASSLC